MTSCIILVTGANRGIGFSIVEAFGRASPKDTIILGSRDRGDADTAIAQLQQKIGTPVDLRSIQLDVRSQADVQHAKDQLMKDFGRLDGKLRGQIPLTPKCSRQ